MERDTVARQSGHHEGSHERLLPEVDWNPCREDEGEERREWNVEPAKKVTFWIMWSSKLRSGEKGSEFEVCAS